MARLPVIGEVGWGAILNEFLGVAHNSDGTLKIESELAYAEITSPVTVSATSEASPNDIVSSGALTYEAVRICIEFYSPSVTVGGTADSWVLLNLWDDSTELGRMAIVRHSTGTQPFQVPVLARRYLTPTAASHTYRIRAWRLASNGTVDAGSGAIGNAHPAYIRITTVDSA